MRYFLFFLFLCVAIFFWFFFFSSRRRHTRYWRDWSSDVCSSDLPDTGQVRVENYVAVSDCGTVLYPIGAEGQIEGALAQGIGYTLSEGFVMENGGPVNPN